MREEKNNMIWALAIFPIDKEQKSITLIASCKLQVRLGPLVLSFTLLSWDHYLRDL